MLAATQDTVTAQAFAPDVITKELAFAKRGDQRKIRLSTNFLPLMGFEPGQRHSVEVLGFDKGIRIAFDANGKQKVYQREYKTRRNNPFEAVVEIGAQNIIDAAMPSYAERMHFTMRPGEIIIRPLENRTFSIRRSLKASDNPFAAFVAMTSGVDIHCLRNTGFTIDSVLEYRPHEARDKNDLTETGALNAIANSSPRVLINEDISRVSWERVQDLMQGGPQISVLHISLQCDEFSNVKSQSLKEKALADLSTTHDLVYDALRCVETVRPACVMLENVPGFSTAPEGQLFKTKLRKFGYHVAEAVMKAPDHGGKTRRERYYLVASVFPGFEMPAPQERRASPLWAEIEPFLAGCRDISHTKSLQDGLTTGRSRLLKPDSLYSPTLLKSQCRQAKDSLYVAMPDGRYLMPSLDLQRFLNGIPDDFSLDCVSESIGSEIVGQSIEYPMHHAICKQLHAHIADNVGGHTVVSIARESKAASVLLPTETGLAARQMSFL